ncbi:MAG: formyltransferase family protein [bacterium]|nr:formyltransferase family protein [bacterium]
MKILYMGNNYVGYEIIRWLSDKKENIVGLVIHPKENEKYTKDMIKVSGVKKENIFLGNKLNEKVCINAFKKLKPDIILSVFFNYILGEGILNIPPRGCVNLHPGYLPFNKGQFPNVWSIIEGTPAGVTMHYMDKKIDTGDIIARKKVNVEFEDTGETLYLKLEKASIELFKKNWNILKTGKNKRFKQQKGGTYHKTADVKKIDIIDLNKSYKAKDLINILRARTFPPYESAYVKLKDSKVYIRIAMKKVKDV